jgi:integrase
VSLDAGLRPVEVKRASLDWIDTDNSVLRIPKQDSAKSRDNWIVSIRDRTATFLDRWCAERGNYDKYEDTDKLWLTRERNPYGSQALRYVLHQSLFGRLAEPRVLEPLAGQKRICTKTALLSARGYRNLRSLE